MKMKWLLLALALLMPVAASGAAAGQQSPAAGQQPRESGATGGIYLTVHAHSSEFGSPGGHETLFATTPLEIPITVGSGFSYSAIPCSVPAPFNDRSLSFNPDYPGIEEPASTRTLVAGTITEATGDHGTLKGTLTTILCQSEEQSGSRILADFQGRFNRASDNEVRVRGTFEITGGAGTFEDIVGKGSINGSLTCLPGTLANVDAESCADLGVFSDAVLRLRGNFHDPTV